MLEVDFRQLSSKGRIRRPSARSRASATVERVVRPFVAVQSVIDHIEDEFQIWLRSQNGQHRFAHGRLQEVQVWDGWYMYGYVVSLTRVGGLRTFWR